MTDNVLKVEISRKGSIILRKRKAQLSRRERKHLYRYFLYAMLEKLGWNPKHPLLRLEKLKKTTNKANKNETLNAHCLGIHTQDAHNTIL